MESYYNFYTVLLRKNNILYNIHYFQLRLNFLLDLIQVKPLSNNRLNYYFSAISHLQKKKKHINTSIPMFLLLYTYMNENCSHLYSIERNSLSYYYRENCKIRQSYSSITFFLNISVSFTNSQVMHVLENIHSIL